MAGCSYNPEAEAHQAGTLASLLSAKTSVAFYA